MKFATLLAITGSIGILFGVIFLLIPAAGIAQYGTTTDATGLQMARFFGGALLYLGLLFFAVRRVAFTDIRPIAGAACVGELAGLWVALRLQFSGTVNALGWSSVLLYGVLALAFGYFALRTPSAA